MSENVSDIRVFISEYKDRIKEQLRREEASEETSFISFAKTQLSVTDIDWLQDNDRRFFKDTPNKEIIELNYLSESGFITCMVYSPQGDFILVGFSSGLLQMRHGTTGVVLCTLRNIQFPPKPVYAIVYSQSEERICYAACMDGIIYRIEVPNIIPTSGEVPEYCIRADPALECLNVQFYGAPDILTYATPFVTQRSAPLSFGITADHSKMIVGYSDTSIKVYDMETQEADLTYKVHKLRLQFIPKKLQRMHCGQVCALKCHADKPYTFASAGWDRTLRIWDIRCKVGCVTTFEGVNVCSDSIDLNRDHCIVGSWQPTEALTVWDLVARKRLNIIRVQNRRPNVDGEYIYACQYWKSDEFNRKGKYGIIGGSGTNCVEIINLHNRYITCSYPAAGTVLAIASHNSKIAFGGTAPVFNIASFFDPKHEKEKYEIPVEPDYDNIKAVVTLSDDEDSLGLSEEINDVAETKSVVGANSLLSAKVTSAAASTLHST